jgi:hypothetical protein
MSDTDFTLAELYPVRELPKRLPPRPDGGRHATSSAASIDEQRRRFRTVTKKLCDEARRIEADAVESVIEEGIR